MIVSGVNQVVSIHSDRIKPLSPIFKGPSLSCFSKVLIHEGSLILLLTPEGIVKVVGETSDVLNCRDMPDSEFAVHTMEKNITLIKDMSTISDRGPMSLVERWTTEPDSYESLQIAVDTEFTPPAENEETADIITELFDITGADDESQCESASFPANLLQNDRDDFASDGNTEPFVDNDI